MINLINRVTKQTFGLTLDDAHAQGICIQCQKPVLVMAADGTSKYNPELFYSREGKVEWNISAMCEKCFDNMFEEVSNGIS